MDDILRVEVFAVEVFEGVFEIHVDELTDYHVQFSVLEQEEPYIEMRLKSDGCGEMSGDVHFCDPTNIASHARLLRRLYEKGRELMHFRPEMIWPEPDIERWRMPEEELPEDGEIVEVTFPMNHSDGNIHYHVATPVLRQGDEWYFVGRPMEIVAWRPCPKSWSPER